jgi:hypothetical protein
VHAIDTVGLDDFLYKFETHFFIQQMTH